MILVASVLVLAGCLAQWENPYFVVKPSGLNWVIIRQHYMTGPMAGYHVKVSIHGNGTVEVSEGTSALVSNSFAYNTKSDTWGDNHKARTTISEEETNMIFQDLVNNGLFVKRERSIFSEESAPIENAFIYVSANIQNKTTGSPDPVTDPDLLDSLKMTIAWFYQPRPASKKPTLN